MSAGIACAFFVTKFKLYRRVAQLYGIALFKHDRLFLLSGASLRGTPLKLGRLKQSNTDCHTPLCFVRNDSTYGKSGVIRSNPSHPRSIKSTIKKARFPTPLTSQMKLQYCIVMKQLLQYRFQYIL